jgi:hypothetical protein
MKDFITKLIDSLDNHTHGFSGKKLTAFTIVVCVFAAHVKWITLGNFEQLEMVLTIDYAFVATLFGINVVDKKQNPQ